MKHWLQRKSMEGKVRTFSRCLLLSESGEPWGDRCGDDLFAASSCLPDIGGSKSCNSKLIIPAWTLTRPGNDLFTASGCWPHSWCTHYLAHKAQHCTPTTMKHSAPYMTPLPFNKAQSASAHFDSHRHGKTPNNIRCEADLQAHAAHRQTEHASIESPVSVQVTPSCAPLTASMNEEHNDT